MEAERKVQRSQQPPSRKPCSLRMLDEVAQQYRGRVFCMVRAEPI
jgi:hypothetical protein